MNIPKKKTNNYAFIDSQNLNLGVQAMGWKMDWRRFREYLAQQHGVSKAFMFIGYMTEHEALYEQLHEQGYLIVLKRTVDVSSNNEKQENASTHAVKSESKPQVKGNIDADLVLYTMKELPNYSKAIIVSGDGDFCGLAEYLVERRKLKNIMTPNWRYSSLLKPFEQYIIRLDEQRKYLAYRDRAKNGTQQQRSQ